MSAFADGQSRRVRIAAIGAFAFAALTSAYIASEAESTSSAISPPVIRETFTRLPCPNDPAERATTIGGLGCLRQHVLRTDAQINRRAKVIFLKLYDATAKRRFVAAERSWLVYRDTLCKSVADILRGGSAQPLLFARCVVDRNIEHFRQLASLYALVLRR